MRIVFMGTPDFAVPSLNALVEAGHNVCGVFSQPDKPVGRHQNKLKATLYYWDESMLSKSDYSYSKQKSKNVSFEFSGEKVDTITIFEDFEFPVSYKNLINTYPVIKIESTVKSASDVNKGYARDFNIDRIILKNKDTK